MSIKNISCVYHSKELFIEKNSLPENQVPKIIHSQEMMDEFIFGFIHSENRKVELPGSKPDYAIKIATKQKNIWWLENFIWINQDQIITSNNNDLEKNEVFINFDVKDQEESFINGKAILSLDGNFIEKEITKGHNELVFSVKILQTFLVP